MKKSCHLLAILLIPIFSIAQSLPGEWWISNDGHRMIIGGQAASGLYDSTLIRSLNLNFAQPNYWQLMLQNYQTHTDIPATLIVDGITYDSVGVRFKGQTSYTQVQGQKKSFNISLDYHDPNQKLMGYQTLNLNNGFQDRSFIREAFYENNIKRYVPAAKANYVRLYLNNQDWGIYTNVQQLNKDFLEEWYFSNDGANWRADRPLGGPPPQPGWGAGTSAFNYLGTDTALYQQYYTLKSNDVVQNPWDKLVHLSDVLCNTPIAQLPQTLPQVLNIDRTLWFLACEIAYSDDDSYVHKGEMDYYCYYEPESGLIHPQEFDANSVMDPTKVNWDAFYKSTNQNYPLMYKMFQVPEWRQRYLAHLRTILNHDFDPLYYNGAIDRYYQHIDALFNADPKKIYTYAQFQAEKQVLKNFMQDRRNFLFSNPEVAQPLPVFSFTEYRDTNQVSWNPPVHLQGTDVRAQVTFVTGMQSVKLWVSSSLNSSFVSYPMFDDGLHQDGLAGDNLYGAHIQGYPAGTVIRFYVEGVAANPNSTKVFFPEGAEHDVFYYVVAPAGGGDGNVVINELLASNTSGVADNFGEYDDWIELYNSGSSSIDISGWYLSDNVANLSKWQIPAGTVIPADGYAIFWADEDSSQGANHMNFKLSSLGEHVMLLNAAQQLMDSVVFGVQQTDQAYARVPNGSGPFVIQGPTHAASNSPSALDEDFFSGLTVFPNPALEAWYLDFSTSGEHQFFLYDACGRVLKEGRASDKLIRLDAKNLSPGVYFLRTGGEMRRLVKG